MVLEDQLFWLYHIVSCSKGTHWLIKPLSHKRFFLLCTTLNVAAQMSELLKANKKQELLYKIGQEVIMFICI